MGTYSISVSATGFKGFAAKGIVVGLDQEYTEREVTVGSTAEIVEVAASPVQVDTTDIELSNVVDSTEMAELPLIGRGFDGLELTLPGVQASNDRFGTYPASGGETQQSEFLINGADTNDIALNTVALNPNLDAIDQFNLIDGPLNAEYDRNSGGIVSATIKEGTNHFHGDVFEFYRDTFLNTLSYFQKSVTTGTGVVQPYHQNIFGGTVGGPHLPRQALLLLALTNGTRQRVPDGSGNVSVYDAANLAGNFSVEDNPASQGTRPAPDPTTGAIPAWGLWSGNAIPASVTIPGCNTAGETWSQCAYDLGGVIPTSAF